MIGPSRVDPAQSGSDLHNASVFYCSISDGLFAGMTIIGRCREAGDGGEECAEELLGGAIQEPYRRGHDARLLCCWSWEGVPREKMTTTPLTSPGKPSGSSGRTASWQGIPRWFSPNSLLQLVWYLIGVFLWGCRLMGNNVTWMNTDGSIPDGLDVVCQIDAIFCGRRWSWSSVNSLILSVMVVVLLIPLRDRLSFRELWFWLARRQHGLITKFEMPLMAQSNPRYPLS
jgi:hypothetical protein